MPVRQRSSAAGILRHGHEEGPQAPAESKTRRRVSEFAAWTVFTPTADDIVAAIDLHTEAKIGFWDAMIVLAAAESECDVLWTEDLNDGQLLRGVRIQNPFTGTL